MDYATSDLLAAAQSETCQDAFTLEEVEQYAMHFLRWLFPLAPEGAMTEVLRLYDADSNGLIGPDGFGSVKAMILGAPVPDQPGILKIVGCHQALVGILRLIFDQSSQPFIVALNFT